MPAFHADYIKAKEALQEVLRSMDSALVVMNRLARFKTHNDADHITLMNQRLSHVRRYREDFDTYFVAIEEAACALENARE